MDVSWAWQDEKQGLITWTFSNTSENQESAILLRGAPGVSPYYFGDCFYEIYVNNGYSFENGPPSALSYFLWWETGSPPLAVIGFPQADGTTSYIVTFVFTLGPGETWNQTEGGFQAGGPTNPQLFLVDYQGLRNWCIGYDPNLPSQYDAQTGSSNQAFEPNPAPFVVALFSAPSQAPWVPFDPENVATSFLKFASIMAPDNGQAWWWYWGIQPEDIQGLLAANNARPVQLAPYWDTDSVLKFVVLMAPNDGQAWWWYWGIQPEDIQSLLTENNAQPEQLLPYLDTDGTLRFAIIMVPDNGQGWWWYWGIEPEDVESILTQNNAQPVQLAPYWDTDGILKLAIIMLPDNGQAWWWWWGIQPEDIQGLLTENNARPVQLDPYWDTDGSLKFVFIMLPDDGQAWEWWWGLDPDGTARQMDAGNQYLLHAMPYLGC
ncbi:MAG: hypothetical protein ACLQU9_07830 [Acidimicrobiales bacterium]|jgi:hypothetical protein